MDKVAHLPESESICGISWSKRHTHWLGYGDSQGIVRVVDVNKQTCIASVGGHTARVGSLAFSGNLLASGSRDRSILVRDLRCNNGRPPNEALDFSSQMNNNVMKYQGHKQEICGLKFSFDGSQLASGGNDNKLILWSSRHQQQLTSFNAHTAAVKALAWSPHQYNLLASGGGTADRTIRFWNTNTLQQQQCVDTGSQVCNLVFSTNSQELISTHGYSLNQIICWKTQAMTKVATLTGHSMRVLYLAISPNGQTIVTGAGVTIHLSF